MADLEKDARDALLTGITKAVDTATPAELEKLANALALTLGASKHRLPGLQVSVSS